MSILYNAVQPESLRPTYSPNDTIDLVINAEGQLVIGNSIKIEATLDVPLASPALPLALQEIQLDKDTGAHSLFQTMSVEFQNQGVIENCVDYPRFVRQYMDCNSTNDDMFNSTQLVELKAPSNLMAKCMLNNQAGTGVDFALKPMLCLNRVIESDETSLFIDPSKTGTIIIRLRVASSVAALYGSLGVIGDFTLSDIKLTYRTLPYAKILKPVIMRSYVGLKQIVNGGMVNINTTVPAICSGVSCSFIDTEHMNVVNYNNLETEKLPNVQEVIFMFNSSTNEYITYPLKTDVEIREHYLESLNMSGHSQLVRGQNTTFGIGLDFNDQLDLRNKLFSCQIKSDAGTLTYQMFMYFHTLIRL